MNESTPTPKIATQRQPSCAVPVLASLLWPSVSTVLIMLGYDVPGIFVAVTAVGLLVAGAFCRALRSGLSPAIVQVIPIWGIVARLDRIATCKKLHRAGIYTDKVASHTIPATTIHCRNRKERTYTVMFNGAGEPDMDPGRIDTLLTRNVRVWGCRSFNLQEDATRPGRYTIRMSTTDHVSGSLDESYLALFDFDASGED